MYEFRCTGDSYRRYMKDRMLNVLQRVGRSFMLPIAILPVAGLLLGIGSHSASQYDRCLWIAMAFG